MRQKYLLFIILFFFTFVAQSQELTEAQQNKITSYQEQLTKYKSQSNNSQTVFYLKKIGLEYWNANLFNEAIKYYSEARTIIEQTTNYDAIIEINNYLGTIYSDLKNYSEAQKCYENALTAANKLNNRETTASVLMNLGKIYSIQNKYDEAISKYKEASNIWLELENMQLVKISYTKIAQNYSALSDEKNSTDYYNLLRHFNELALNEKDDEIAMKEKIALAERQRALAKEYEAELLKTQKEQIKDSLTYVEQKNELLKKEQLLKDAALEAEKNITEKQKADIKAKKAIIYSLIGGVVLIVFVFLLMVKLFIDKRKSNKKLKELNEELKTKNSEIEKQRDALEDKNTKIEEQRDALEDKNLKITDSIRYASRIQKAILPSKKAILNSFVDAFIFHKPRDIVSGDFYWFAEHDDYKFIAVVDCTGHSVPGAFMSMIGNTLLNEIINEKKIYNPSLVLKKLDHGISDTLNKESEHSEHDEAPDDGMDMTLCRFDKKNEELIFAAANHQVITFENNEPVYISGEYYSIGGHLKDRNKTLFKNHLVPIKKESIFYLFSDGYPDQFGGKDGKKFMKKRFTNLLKEVHSLPLKEQKNIIEKRLKEWQGNLRQVDDILIIGIKF